MESILHSLGQSIGVWGYIVLFFYSLGGGLVAILAAGILSSGVIESINSLNLAISIFVGGVANFIGSSGLFYLSRYQKSEVMKYFRSHRRKIALSHIWIKRFGFWIIFLQKYLYGIKTIIPIVVGFSKYSARKFVAYNFFASMLWALVIAGVGYIAGDSIKRLYEHSNSYIFPIVGLAILAFIIFIIIKVTKKT